MARSRMNLAALRNRLKGRGQMSNLQERIDRNEILDSAILWHGYAPHMRDYDVIVDIPAPVPGGGGVPYTEGRYCYRFIHCPEVRVTTALPFEQIGGWTWDDAFINYEDWLRAGEPDGYVWGTCFAHAYPGLSYVPDSELAASWAKRMGREMHEVLIESNAHKIELVCHDLIVLRAAAGDPVTGELTPVFDPRLRSPYLDRPVTHMLRYW
jgi:hypothetical protein